MQRELWLEGFILMTLGMLTNKEYREQIKYIFESIVVYIYMISVY